MRSTRKLLWMFFLAILSLLNALCATAQTLIATVPVGTYPQAVAVNTAANNAYVLNTCNIEYDCNTDGTVTVINGATLSTTNVTVGIGVSDALSTAIAVNQATNKIYVANACGNDPICRSHGTVTVIDGVTLATMTVTVGFSPVALAVNQTTDKIYVLNGCGNEQSCQGDATVTVIDGVTLSTTSVTVGPSAPYTIPRITLNPVTNKIFVTNPCGDINCQSPGTVSVIDGSTLVVQTVTVGIDAQPIAVNTTTNTIYVANAGGGSASVTVINGTTLSTTSVPVGVDPVDIAVNPVTNMIYTADTGDGTVTIIDGATLSTQTLQFGVSPWKVAVNSNTNTFYVIDNFLNYLSTVNGGTFASANLAVGKEPIAAALNPTTNVLYIANQGDNTVSVVNATNPAALQFVAATPCRVVDTRNPDGPFGGPPIQGGKYRNFAIPQNPNCQIPNDAAAYSLNVTVVPHGRLNYLTVWPTGQPQPLVSTMNSPDGRVKANAAIVPAGSGQAVNVYATDTTDVILDIDGYFAAPGSQTYEFYPLTPCRVADTRSGSNEPKGLGPPSLQAKQQRDLPILSSPCLQGITNPLAYSFNITVVPNPAGEPLGYLTIWPSNQSQPVVSTLNNPTATVVANAAIVPAAPDGDIDVYAYNSTDLIIDINGYFGAPAQGGLSLYTIGPCRALDTRGAGGGEFSGLLPYPVLFYGLHIACGVWDTAQAYVLNATVVPNESLGYLTLWANGSQQPGVSTLNAYDGAVTSNMAITPAGQQGGVNAYAYGKTNLILDVFGYFAP